MAVPPKTNFVVFQGGGGKGVAYLGALKALEEKKVLTLSALTGVGGASAGAITALLTACRLPREASANQPSMARIVDSAKFESLLQGFHPGIWRVVTTAGPDRPHGARRNQSSIGKPIERPSIGEGVESFLAVVAKGWAFDIASILYFQKGWEIQDPAIRRLLNQLLNKVTDLADAMQCFWNDLGLFDGIPLRGILNKWVADAVKSRRRKDLVDDANAGRLTFKTFCDAMEMDLRITGTNITTQRPFVFSKHNSPNFPVTEAVGISMTIPFLFKPVEVWSGFKGVDPGLWVDGGCLNNLPLHCFDSNEIGGPRLPSGATKPLEPGVLALQLVPGSTEMTGLEQVPDDRKRMGFGQFASSLGETLLYPGNLGQILSKEDASHVVPIHCGELSTCNFSPTQAQKDDAASEAYQSVTNWLQRAY
jgi:predicted acylesterase/phospholipase RssA